jgi:UDP-N-acetylmuramoyl-tripeptide--D-alanyl-D-alanine ligase
MALAAGATLEHVAAGLSAARPVAGRQVQRVLASGAVLIDDSYNANPGSVGAAIETLAIGGGEAWLVLGDMRELGEGELLLHAEIGERARRAGLKRLYTVGTLAREASRAFGDGATHFDDQAALVAALREALGPGVRCLVKGSRSSAMDKVVAALADADKDTGGDHHAA